MSTTRKPKPDFTAIEMAELTERLTTSPNLSELNSKFNFDIKNGQSMPTSAACYDETVNAIESFQNQQLNADEIQHYFELLLKLISYALYIENKHERAQRFFKKIDQALLSSIKDRDLSYQYKLLYAQHCVNLYLSEPNDTYATTRRDSVNIFCNEVIVHYSYTPSSVKSTMLVHAYFIQASLALHSKQYDSARQHAELAEDIITNLPLNDFYATVKCLYARTLSYQREHIKKSGAVFNTLHEHYWSREKEWHNNYFAALFYRHWGDYLNTHANSQSANEQYRQASTIFSNISSLHPHQSMMKHDINKIDEKIRLIEDRHSSDSSYKFSQLKTSFLNTMGFNNRENHELHENEKYFEQQSLWNKVTSCFSFCTRPRL